VLDVVALRARLDNVRERIARAASRSGRDAASIRLVAISKTFPADHVRAAAAAGQLDFGENKVQEALPKMDALADLPLRWHLVGHLQSNKARKVGGAFHCVHSVDDPALLSRLDDAARAAGRVLELLIQVDLAGESTKHGARADGVRSLIEQSTPWTSLRICGLMTLPPAVDDPSEARPYFAALRLLRDDLIAQGIDPQALSQLSMGMSHDFEVAVEEGATMVRVGTAIFGTRPR
jgi:pyridoxal phosphate enzyme (YggS family)